MADEKVSIKMKIAIAGATGLLGPYIVDALLKSDRYQICILKWKGSSSTTKELLPVREVDYQSPESLRSALEGQHAAVAAGVKRIIPSEFGNDLQNPLVREFPTYRTKVLIEELLEHHRSHSGVSYTFIYTNTLLDWAISSQGRLLLNPLDRTVNIYDGGNKRFSTATMATVGKAVVGVLDHYESTANRPVYVYDVMITQNEILEMAKALTAGDGGRDWTVTHLSTDELEPKARLAWQQGSKGLDVFYGFAVSAAFSAQHGYQFSNGDNALFGIIPMERTEVADLIRKVLKDSAEQ